MVGSTAFKIPTASKGKVIFMLICSITNILRAFNESKTRAAWKPKRSDCDRAASLASVSGKTPLDAGLSVLMLRRRIRRLRTLRQFKTHSRWSLPEHTIPPPVMRRWLNVAAAENGSRISPSPDGCHTHRPAFARADDSCLVCFARSSG